ncbi:PE domain-containing protein [Saccharopolyspora gloriosae]|uniref:PE domain-containing protein n=1 Tax=Saccharopolyspora gloriosae TaxID=455344 RepID=UPI001FB798F7|nr:PE domain-containing protein [Saccharopolyspora gloriosae]
MATINTTVNNGGVSSGASFSVDTDAIPGMIAKYEDAREQLGEILNLTRRSGMLKPPGNDEVSKAAAKAIGDLMGGSDQGITKVVTDAREHLQEQINQLKAAQKDYQSADEAATPTQS